MISWILALFGVAYLLGHSRASQGPREVLADWKPFGLTVGLLFVESLECPFCCAFWFGLLVGKFVIEVQGWDVLGFAFSAGAASYCLARWTGLVPSAESEAKERA